MISSIRSVIAPTTKHWTIWRLFLRHAVLQILAVTPLRLRFAPCLPPNYLANSFQYLIVGTILKNEG
jgi:hypothetical protein